MSTSACAPLVERADAARTEFLELADRDAHAFDGVMAGVQDAEGDG